MKKIFLPLVLVLVVSCGSSSSNLAGNAQNGSCQSSSACQDLVGSQYGAAPFAQNCSSGTFSSSICPTNNRVGSCDMFSGQANEYINRYYSTGNNPYTITSAPMDCQTGSYTSN
jgi:hypothetical protein